MDSSPRKNGFILLFVIGLMLALTIIVIHVTQATQAEKSVSLMFMNKVRSRVLARSGVSTATALLEGGSPGTLSGTFQLTGSYGKNQAVGDGTFVVGGDNFTLTLRDASGKININDGVLAGKMELGNTYLANQVNPWPGNVEDTSGLINLRLRRLLNAYGDVIRIRSSHFDATGRDTLDVADYGNGLPVALTSSATGKMGTSMPGGNGLGDTIIAARPTGGYSRLKDIEILANNWAQGNVSAGFLQFRSGWLTYKTFYDLLAQDVTVVSYEDLSFKRFSKQQEMYGGTYKDTANGGVGYDSYFQNDTTNCRFNPNYIDTHPYDLSGSAWGGALFMPHAVPLINLNAASEDVKAAVFFAPVNVTYLCEGAVTHTHYQEDRYYNHSFMLWDHLIDTGYARTSIGVRGVCFRPGRMVENGSNRALIVQRNRFMSLRDALTLAKHLPDYDRNGDSVVDPIEDFVDFKKALRWHREQIATGGEPAPDDILFINGHPGYGNCKTVYERAEPITLDPATYCAMHVKPAFGRFSTLQIPHRVSADDVSRDVEVVWVSQYWKSSNVDDGNPVGQWHGGWFLDDYVERTLPHAMSCTRRLPGFLGAPLALTSPYMMVEPFAYTTDLSGTTDGTEYLGTPATVFGRDNVKDTDYALDPEWPKATQRDNAANPNDWQLGRQPKLSAEDLVMRHTLPKLAFSSTGIFDIMSTGRVDAGESQVSAETRFMVSLKLFDRKSYRSQADFDWLNNGSHADIALGPEFTHTASDTWLACTLRDADDADGAGVQPNTSLQQIDLFDVYLKCRPGSELLNHDITLTDQANVLCDHPTWANQSVDPFHNLALGNMTNFDLETTGAWAAQDGSNCDPFGQGVFLDQNNHGEWSANVFQDSLYWNLNEKRKSWDNTNPATAGFYGAYPTGLGFHRGFAAAWFRVPTSYPFAQPVFYYGPDWPHATYQNVCMPMTQLRHTIFALNLHESIQMHNTVSSASPQPLTSMRRPVAINVGYYSGFDGYYSHANDSNWDYANNWSYYTFEHGLYGEYTAGSRVYGGSVVVPPATQLVACPFNTNAEQPPVANFLPYQGGSWSYGTLSPYYHTYNLNFEPWIVDEGALGGLYGYANNPFNVNHNWSSEEYVHQERYWGTMTMFSSPWISTNLILHKLPMNSTPECGPGSWHRVYAFWFIRNNRTPGRVSGVGGFSGALDGTPVGDGTYWPGGVSRYYATDNADAPAGNAAGCVDALDQFGIWFRDDSNFTETCADSAGNIPEVPTGYTLGTGYSHPVKPHHAWILDFWDDKTMRPFGSTHCNQQAWLPQDPNMYFSVGEMPVNRTEYYEPMSGEGIHNAGDHPETFHHPAYRLDSTVDDIIFAYGPNISNPSPSNAYFRGLFYNANWMENEPEDEVRYKPTGQELILNVGKDLPANATLYSVITRSYRPQDTYINSCDLELEVRMGGIVQSPLSQTVSRQSQWHSLTSVANDTEVRFRFLPNNRLGAPLKTESVIFSYGSLTGLDYMFDTSDPTQGDSFTNAPCIQEVTLVYKAGPTEVLSWVEE